VPAAVIGGSNEFEDFWCHRGVAVLQCHIMCQQKMSKYGQKVVEMKSKNC
jgi:hypothetical protein